jgi:hypothetical protein
LKRKKRGKWNCSGRGLAAVAAAEVGSRSRHDLLIGGGGGATH